MVTHTDQLATSQGRLRLLLENNQYSDLMDEVASAIQQQPQDIALRFLASEASERLGALPEAADHLSAILSSEPHHLEANRRLAGILAQLGDATGSIRCCRRVVAAIGENNSDAVTLLAVALSKGGQHDSAIELLTKRTATHVTEAAGFANLGVALSVAGRDDEALTASTRALELDPRSAQAHCTLGIIHYKEARWQQAILAFQATERFAPDLAVGSLNLGLALEHLGDRDGARSAILRAAALEPEDDEIQQILEPLLVTQVSTFDNQDSEEHSASMKGSLEGFDLLNLLEFLRLQDKTGSLVISAQAGVGIIVMERGMLIGGSAPGIKPLGNILINRRLVSREDLQIALSQHQELNSQEQQDVQQNSTNLAVVLLREGLVDDKSLSKVVFQTILDVLSSVTQWHEGAFAFHPSEDSGFPLRFNVQEVILELMRREDERKHSPSESPK